MPYAETTLPAGTRSVGAARRFLEASLRKWGADALEWLATTVISELTTNAVLHARTPFTVRIDYADGVLRVEVTDGSPRPPVPHHYGVEATTGRGIALVQMLSRAWGFVPDGAGKTVWCELVADPASPDDLLDSDALIEAFAEPIEPEGPGWGGLGPDVTMARAA